MTIDIVSTVVGTDNQLVSETVKAVAAKHAAGNEPDASAAEDKVEADVAEADEANATEDSTGDDKPDTGESEQEDANQSPKKKSGFEKRIEKLNKRATIAEVRAAELEAELARFRQPAPQKEEQANFGLVKPKAEDFDTHADYIEAMYEFSAKKAEAKVQIEREQAEQAASMQKVQTKFAEAMAKGPELFDDFDEVTDLSDFGMQPTRAFATYMRSIEDPKTLASVMYHLGQNRDELKAIMGMSELATVRALTKLEARLEAPAKPAAKEEAPVTKAPKPPTSVSGARTSRVAELTDDMSYDEYRRARQAQLKAKKRN